ncbi:MAG: ABC transporter permease [Terriglobales bacterium]
MPTAADISTAVSTRPQLVLSEIVGFAFDTFRTNKVRFLLTSLGMMIGTASLILVTTIGLTGKQYVLNLIQGIGANMIEAEYQQGEHISMTSADELTIDDMHAVEEQVPGIAAASPVVPMFEHVAVGNGKERDLQVLGVDSGYADVRNLIVLAGRFFDKEDSQQHNKVGVVTEKYAREFYGSSQAALGKTIKLTGLPFTIIGTFRERVDTFGQSEVTDYTMLIPYSVIRFFRATPNVRQIYFSAADPSLVIPITAQIQRLLQLRHRPESVYKVSNLTQLLSVADKTANTLTAVLLAVSLVVLLVSGIGIMNIMLATVSARIREIGIRKAMGATNREIRFQFLSEAILISLIGGVAGIIVGLAIPFSVRFLTEYRIPISGLSALIAIAVSSLVGIIFGTIPATRAALLDPVESLRYE